ncbi:MAG: AAA family ATPase [Thermoplasmata archaeon]|nr:AAA family ATPase [Thermoplasmata archaeon]
MASGAAPGGARPFIGRADVIDALKRRGDAARAGHGGFTLVEGDAGVGKSTLVTVVVAEARARGMRVLLARAAPLDNPPPYDLIRGALVPAAKATGPASGATGSPLAFAPDLGGEALMIGFAGRADPGAAPGAWPVEERLLESITGPGEPAETSRERLLAQLADQVLDPTHHGTTMLVLEDLQLADEPSLEFLEYLAPQLENHSLWIVGTCLSTGLLGDRRRASIDRIIKASDAERLSVRPLTPSELADFVRQVAGREVPAEEITRWHSQTGGNPQFVEQLLRTRGVDEGPDPATTLEGPGPPELAQYLARQLPKLAEDEHRAMSVASVLGKGFTFQLLLKASGEDEEHLAEITEHLVRRGILRERGDEQFEFVRDELRAEVYGSLTDTRRRLLHKKAAEALEATGAADVATIFALARHFYLGKIDDRAQEYNRLAAEFAARSKSPAVARDHLERALECHRRARPLDRAGEAEIALELAVQLDRLGELKSAEGLLRELIRDPERLAEVGPRQQLLVRVYLAHLLTEQGRWEEVETLTTELAGLPETNAHPLAQIAVHRLRGEVRYYLGRYDESLTEHDQALALARKAGDARETALEVVRRANVLGMIPGRFEEAVHDYREATESLIALGERGEAAYALLFLGVVQSQHHQNAQGLLSLQRALALAEEAHDLRRIGWSLFNIADLLQEEGRLEEAEERNRRSRAILEKVGDRFGLAQTHIIAGKILRKKPDLAEAEIELLEAYRLVRELHTTADELDVVLRLAEVAWARGDHPQAASRVEELGRREIERVRPDLAADYLKLRTQLGGEAGHAGSPPP